MANENANRFLRSYNKIEAQLKLLYGGKATQNFTDLVKRCTDVNITVRRYETPTPVLTVHWVHSPPVLEARIWQPVW